MEDLVERKETRAVTVGNIIIGGGAPVVVQSMTNTRTGNPDQTVAQIEELASAGCELVRVAVPDREAAQKLGIIKKQISLPLVADIHFDYRLALEAIEQGVDKIRINPGNINGRDRVKEIVEACQNEQVAIRVGVNAGSLAEETREKYGAPTAAALVESALKYVRFIENLGFTQLIVSLKSSQVPTVIEAYRMFAEKSDYPLHLGVTEAGSYPDGAIKSAAGLGPLLHEGIGDTIRVSLTGSPVREIKAAFDILQMSGRRLTKPEIITCPTCGRLEYDLEAVAAEVRDRLADCDLPIRVAIMGCAVNGPGEAREADIGIAGGKGEGLLFRQGEIIKKVGQSEMVEALLAEIESL